MTQPTDKDGFALQPGDYVELVYGGEPHVMRIEALSQHLTSGLHQVHGTVQAVVPAGAVRRVQPRSEAPATTRTSTVHRTSTRKEK